MRLVPGSAVLVVGALVVLGCATGGPSGRSGAEAIAARQQLMKEQGAAMRAMQEKAKAGQFQALAPEAEKLAQSAKRIPALFPEGSLDPATSRAKPEIWQKWSEFEGYARTLEAKAAALAATSRAGDGAATTTALADLGKTTCGACHNTFRGPEIKK